MTVKPFPPAEPWPAELFAQFGVRDLEQLVADAQAEIVRRRTVAAGELAMCGDCGADVHPSQTKCDECGTHLTPSNPTASAATSLDGMRAADAEEVTMLEHTADCTCNRCYLAELDKDPFSRALEAAIDIVTAPDNVRRLPGQPVVERQARRNF